MHLTFGACTSPTDTFYFTYHPFNGPGMCAVDNFQPLGFGKSWSPDKFKGNCKKKSLFMFTFTLRNIYEVYGIARYLEIFSPATDNDAIISALLQHQEENFSKVTDKNRSKIDCNKSVLNKWSISSLQE